MGRLIWGGHCAWALELICCLRAAEVRRGALQTLLVGVVCGGVLGLLSGD
jgi:hypothetical protein